MCATSWLCTTATRFLASKSDFSGSRRNALVLPVIKPYKVIRKAIVSYTVDHDVQARTQFSIAPFRDTSRSIRRIKRGTRIKLTGIEVSSL